MNISASRDRFYESKQQFPSPKASIYCETDFEDCDEFEDDIDRLDVSHVTLGNYGQTARNEMMPSVHITSRLSPM